MVAYMQCVGAVPNLQAQTSHQDALKEHWWQRAKDRTHRTTIRHFDVSHMSQAPPGWQAKTVFADLSQAALGFFQHYANFPFDKQIVSIKACPI